MLNIVILYKYRITKKRVWARVGAHAGVRVRKVTQKNYTCQVLFEKKVKIFFEKSVASNLKRLYIYPSQMKSASNQKAKNRADRIS